MQDLTLVGLTEDRSRLVLVSEAGEEFTLPVDAKLRAALRGVHARPGQLEIQMESALRPRDIQARIRAGESPEEVAEAARTTVDKIMAFAMPVLAERAHIAERAQSSSLRRRAGEGPARLLGDAATDRLRSRNVDPQSVEWDAWRREDGRWTVVADFSAGEKSRRASFVFDVPGRYVVAEDAEALWLVGDPGEAESAPTSSGANLRRLTPVATGDRLPLGVDAIDLVRDGDGTPPGVTDTTDEPTVDLTGTAATVRERRPARADDLTVGTGDADWMATQASDRPADSERSAGGQDRSAVAQQSAEEEATKPTARKPTKRKGRASVPSWDEIMFGGGRAE